MTKSSSRRSVKQKIADDLRNQIRDCVVAPGERLATEAELMEEYSVARNTARDALGILINEGLIISRSPQGYFLRDVTPMEYRPQGELIDRPKDAPKDSFLTELADRKPSQTIDVAIVEPPPDVASRLGLKDDELAVVRKRLRSLDERPFYSNDSYYPLSVVQGSEIMSPHDIPQGANLVLAELGHVQVRATDEIYVRMPNPDEVQRLDLPPGTPIAYHLVTGYSDDDRPLRCVINTLPGDRHVIMYERSGL